jgi:serine protease
MIRSLARSALRVTTFAGLLTTLCAARAHAAPPGPPDAQALSFFDGARDVQVTRLEAPAARGKGSLSPVALRYPGRTREINAFVDHTAIVDLEPGAEPQLLALGARIIRPLMPSLGLYLVEDTTGGDGIDVAHRLQPGAPALHGIRRASPNLYFMRKAYGEYTPDDPRLKGQWYFENLKMTEAWGLSRGDSGTSIVVIDTGCDLSHPDLKDKMDPGIDAIDDDDDPSPNLAEQGAAHGTACAGLVAASTNNGVGIAGGCPECRMRCVRLVNNMPVPLSADIAAFQLVLESGAAVASNSWGFSEPTPVPAMLADAINNVFDNGRGGKGALIVFAMGNDDREVADDELQAVRGVLAIGAINNLDAATQFTNKGKCNDLVAPTGTLTTDISGADGDDPTDYTTLFGGTSSACPVAAGIAALLVSAAPDRTSAELYDVLIQTARTAPYAKPDANGHDPLFGYGIINPVKALKSVLDSSATGGSGGSAGSSTTSAGASGSASGGSSGSGSGGTGPDEAGDCSCRTGPAPLGEGALVYLAALGLVVARLSRRREARR